MVEILILDFGGVISKTLFETHRSTEQALGLPENSLQWLGPFAPETDSLWRDMIADKISERDYWLARTKETGQKIGKDWQSMQEFVIAARADEPMDVVRPEFLATIAKVKQAGKKLAILSNELDLFYGSDFRKKLPFLKDFDPIIDATYTKILKPDPRAYQFITEQTGLAPEDCLFIDDQMRNIKGAENFGMQTVHFNVKKPQESYQQALIKLNIET